MSPLNNPTIQSAFKAKAETRAMNAASGDVVYTGYGFEPVSLMIYAWVDGTRGSIGSSEPALAEQSISCVDGDPSAKEYVVFVGTGLAYQAAVLKTYDADGFTLTWTKAGGPAGTAKLQVFAFR